MSKHIVAPKKSMNTMALGVDENTCKYASKRNMIALAATIAPSICEINFLLFVKIFK